MPIAAVNDPGIQDILSLLQVQNAYINQLHKMIIVSSMDSLVYDHDEFQEFVNHFFIFMQHHFSSIGFSKAIGLIQVYCATFFEALLDDQVVAAAEQLEIAIGHLEILSSQSEMRINPKMVLLNYGLGLLEETQLKIIEVLEDLIQDSRKNQLPN